MEEKEEHTHENDDRIQKKNFMTWLAFFLQEGRNSIKPELKFIGK